jgi:L-ascorbate metabolism protein UlaG (beta-lactamase superfamily)
MFITWLGHGSFRIEIADQTLLIDPWLTGNPMLRPDQHQGAIEGADHILITHGHFDHTADTATIAKSLGVPVVGIYELMNYFQDQHGVDTIGFNMGGTVRLGQVDVALVPALHSSSLPNNPTPIGREAGFVLRGENRTLYISGDTGITAEMDWIGDYFAPQIGILSAGGHYTMGMKEAAYAAKRYFNFETIIPCHYRTFDLLEQSAEPLQEALPGVNVIEPQVLHPISL